MPAKLWPGGHEGRCLYLAPMKPPDHPNPSGDRLIARQFMELLGKLGFEVELASRLRTRCECPSVLPERVGLAKLDIDACLAREMALPQAERARLVFTYHNYYKAPDLIGPALAAALAVPYVIAEASRAPQRAAGIWAACHARAEAASDAARLILTPTQRDAAMLDALRPPHQRVQRFPPFLAMPVAPPDREARDGPVRLLTVAMMRPGVKIDSYRALASALARLSTPDWRLDIVGDGDARSTVEALFAPFAPRLRWHGSLGRSEELAACYREADIFVWPGVGEAFGMVYLEAQAHGLPCLAYAYGGVSSVVRDHTSGYLCAPGDEEQFVGRLESLIGDPDARRRLASSARGYVERHHSMDAAAIRLAEALRGIGITL